MNWNTRSYLQSCIDSYLNEDVSPESIVVVDQGSTDGSTELMERCYPGVKYVLNSENRGYAHAANIGVQKNKSRLVVISNADVTVHKQTLGAIQQVMDSDETIGLAGCKIYDNQGKHVTRFSRTSLKRGLLLELVPHSFRGRWRTFEHRFFTDGQPFDVTYVEGAFAVVRRLVFGNIGGFDEGFSFFFEDADLPLRMIKAGYRVVHVPQASITHAGGASFSQVPLRHAAEFHKNMLRLYERHALRRAMWFRRMFQTIVMLKRLVMSTMYRLIGISLLENRVRRNKTVLESFRRSFQEVKRQSEYPLVSVIIPTYNRLDCLLRLFSCLRSQTYKNFEVLVVDQSERIDSMKEVTYSQFDPSWKVVRTALPNRSLAKNVGILHARGEILLFCDDDIIAPENFVEAHVICHRNKVVGGVSCRTLEDGLPYVKSKQICRFTFYGKVLLGFQSDVSCTVETLIGMNMSVKRAVQHDVGYFDSMLRGTSIFEEQDFSTRMRRCGYSILFSNMVSVQHFPQPHGNLDSRKNSPADYYHDFHHNEIVYFLKNRNHFCLFLVVPFCLLRSIKQSIRYRLSIREGIHIFLGVFEGFRSYYRSLR